MVKLHSLVFEVKEDLCTELEVQHTTDMRFEAKGKEGNAIIDGRGGAIRPMEVLLSSLGSCVGVYWGMKNRLGQLIMKAAETLVEEIIDPNVPFIADVTDVWQFYIHPHMDEDNFDLGRVSRCGDLVPDESGRMVPACSYNLLYRQKDPRFWRET